MELIVQATSLFLLLLGVLSGEALTYRAFGRPKAAMVLVDVVIFVILISVLFNFITFTQLGWVFYVTNYIIGLLAIIMVRGLEAAFGMTERGIGSSEQLGAGVVRALARSGMTADEIRDLLRRAGFSPKIASRLEGLIETGVPPYLPKLVKMETQIDEIAGSLAGLQAGLDKLRTNELEDIKARIAALGRKGRKRSRAR